MSRTTPHCACRNSQLHTEDSQRHNSKAYSILPNYQNKPEFNRQSSKTITNFENSHSSFAKNKFGCGNRNENEFKNYENIEYYTSGIFRPHSCPFNKRKDSSDIPPNSGDFCTESTLKPNKNYYQNQINKSHHDSVKNNERFQKKNSKASINKAEHKNLNNIQCEEDLGPINKYYFDSKYMDYHSGLNYYMKNSQIPIPFANDEHKSKRLSHTLYNDDNLLTTNMKKTSCGLKYIIFQKLSIMTHFITGSKNRKSTLFNKHNNLSDENLFKEKSSLRTERSKSYHAIETNFDHSTCNKCDNHYKSNLMKKYSKPRTSKIKLSNASNSSSGSIDAHAGSPITIMTTVCGNILSNGSNPLVSNTICHSSKSKWKNEEKSFENFPEIKETNQQRNYNFHKENLNNYQVNQPNLNQHNNNNNNILNINNNNNPITNHHMCNNCPCSSQSACNQMPCEQICGHQCCTKPHVQPSFQSCHYCCCSHSHVVMHPSYSQSPYMCCSPSNFMHHCSISKPICLHSFFPCNPSYTANNACTSSILCNSCQAKNVDRCHSVNLNNNNKIFWNNSNENKQSQNLYSNTQKYRSKGETKTRSSKPTSIPPPPPPPPSSLYSTKEVPIHKSKQKRHYSNKASNSGKVCTHCSEKMPIINQDGADNVQNIIYSHLNNTVACQSSKNNENTEVFQQVKNTSINCENRLKNISRNISWNSQNDKIQENVFRNSKENDQTRYMTNAQDVIDRRSADICRHRSSAATPINSTHKPRFISKTPETYKSKYDRRQKNHQSETKRILKQKSLSTPKEYNDIDQETFYRNDSVDSPEAGSFIYNPFSPLTKRTAPTVAISNLSSFNIHQQHFNLKDKRNNNPEPARKAFQENMLSLREVGWYWGPLSFTEAERLMENKANGTFLVRDSGHDTYFLSLTFRVRETTYHTRIEYSQGTFSFWSQPESHSATTISEFIDKAVAHSQSGKFHYFLLTNVPGQPPMEVSLLYPLTRNQIVHSLKHLSRFVILSNIRKDHIANLNIPSPLKLYLLEKQYYISNLDHFIEATMDAYPLNYKPSISSESLNE